MNIKQILFLSISLCSISHSHAMLQRMQNSYVRKVALQKALSNQQRLCSTNITQSKKTEELSPFETPLAQSFLGPIFAIPGGAIGYGLGFVLARNSTIPYSYFSNEKYDSALDQQLAFHAFEAKASNSCALLGAFTAAGLVAGPIGAVSTAATSAAILAAIFRDDLIRKPSSETK